jgi:uncharacterized membrane protein YeaQ/YmgE (transglycosylase-associated protein family)
MLVIGIVAGTIARSIMPGSEHLGLLLTGALGIAGSFVGGTISRLFSKPAEDAMARPAGLVMPVVGALIFFFAWNQLAR